MSDMNVLPVSTGMGDGTSAGVGGALGALIGSWFGNGWGRVLVVARRGL